MALARPGLEFLALSDEPPPGPPNVPPIIKPIWHFVMVIVSAFISLAACVWLVRTLQKLPPGARHRLFPRMLRSLAWAELLAACAAMPVLGLDFWHIFDDAPFDFKDVMVCGYMFSIFRASRLILCMQEAHLSLVFLAQSARCNWCLPVLNYGVPASWLVGIGLGVWEFYEYPWQYNPMIGKCVINQRDSVSFIAIAACCAVSVVSCLAAMLRSSCGTLPNIVQRRNLKRATGYICVSFITYPAVLAVYQKPDLMLNPKIFFPMAVALESSNGLLNALVYAKQSYRAASIQRGKVAAAAGSPAMVRRPQAASDSDGISYASQHVEFGGVDILELMHADSSNAYYTDSSASALSMTDSRLSSGSPPSLGSTRRVSVR